MTNLNELTQIPGYDKYFADRGGNIYTLHRRINIHKLRPSIGTRGYKKVQLFNSGVTSEHKSVHRLIALTFLGESDLYVNHINGIKTDNRAENLEYCTPYENNQHALKMGLFHPRKGEIHHATTFTEMDVIAIRLWLDNKLIKGKELAIKFGVSKSAVSLIKSRKRWSHI